MAKCLKLYLTNKMCCTVIFYNWIKENFVILGFKFCHGLSDYSIRISLFSKNKSLSTTSECSQCQNMTYTIISSLNIFTFLQDSAFYIQNYFPGSCNHNGFGSDSRMTESWYCLSVYDKRKPYLII